ncbi:hypothetical protein ACIRF8_10415 [Streptomyces sp. NPDC102406]|uniref:hypothetical protein n=1 Tax=Streptomyces sp. NPDC102406 TaxID=3366171 RepID=UPI0037F7011E
MARTSPPAPPVDVPRLGEVRFDAGSRGARVTGGSNHRPANPSRAARRAPTAGVAALAATATATAARGALRP